MEHHHTLETILRCRNPAELEALTDQQLEELFKPYFPSTRPEHVVKKQHNITKAAELLKRHEMTNAKKQAELVLKHFGLSAKL